MLTRLWRIDDVIEPEACRHYLMEAEHRTWYPSSINQLSKRSGKNSRSKTFIEIDAQVLFSSVRNVIPPCVAGMKIVGLARNQFLCLRYQPGEQFSVHTDSPYQGPEGLKSLFTFLVYLNDDFRGGQTFFPKIPLTIMPKAGMALIFPHDEPHGSAEVTWGTKYILRSVVVYQEV
jgi:prolyl 4-hydroxylase